jgi:exosortase/archaeosortase family protein
MCAQEYWVNCDMNILDIRQAYNNVPSEIKKFLFKALVLFVIWQLSYHFVFGPSHVPDRQLNNLTGYATAQFLKLFVSDVDAIYKADKSIITISGRPVIGIANPCNAFDIYALYVGFLLCYPSSAKRKTVFTLCGLPAIFLMNVLRCGGITWLNLHLRSWVDFSHHYVFTTILYVIIFYFWILFTKSPK